MPRSQRNDNFIDKTFTVIADILLKSNYYILGLIPVGRNQNKLIEIKTGLVIDKYVSIEYISIEKMLCQIGFYYDKTLGDCKSCNNNCIALLILSKYSTFG